VPTPRITTSAGRNRRSKVGTTMAASNGACYRPDHRRLLQIMPDAPACRPIQPPLRMRNDIRTMASLPPGLIGRAFSALPNGPTAGHKEKG
jgi:hypothetical protein